MTPKWPGGVEAAVTVARERQQSPLVRSVGLGPEGGDEVGESHALAYPGADQGPCPPLGNPHRQRVETGVCRSHTLSWV